MSAALPEDWRDRVVALVTGTEAPDADTAASWFTGGTGLDPQGQIAVYREQYRLRLGGALRASYPTLAWLVGDAFDTLAMDYLRASPSRTWTLDRIGLDLPDWLEQSGRPRDAVQAARVDRAVDHAFTATDVPPTPPESLRPDLPLRHTPSLTLLRVDRRWHDLRRAVKHGEDPSLGDVAPVDLAIYRVGVDVRDRTLEPLERELLATFQHGATLAEAVTHVVEAGADVEVLQARLGGWFRTFAERGLLVPVQSAR